MRDGAELHTNSSDSSGRACEFRSELWAALALGVLALAGSSARPKRIRPRGGDYLSFQVRNGDPAVCAARCERDARCRAWSFSYPRTANTAATCWLKSQVPPRVEDKCCVSGVRGAGVIEPRKGPIEYSIDRLGGDYRNLDVAADAVGAHMQGGVRGGQQMPCLDLCAAGLHRSRSRAAISRTGSRGRGTSRAAFRVWCGSGTQCTE